MVSRLWLRAWVLCLVLASSARGAETISIEGAPSDTGYNVDSEVTIRATLRGDATRDLARFLVFADISYFGKTAVSSVQLDRQSESGADGARFEGVWLIPPEAPTGVYSVTLRVEDRAAHRVFARQRIRGFSAYRKSVRIARLALDNTFYTVGDPIECEVVLQNLTAAPMKDLRVEFSRTSYPGIRLPSSEGGAARDASNPEPALKVLREHLDLPARSETILPPTVAGAATLLQGQQAAAPGSRGPVRQESVTAPEVQSYALAVWNAGRTVLYDVQVTTSAIVRPPSRDLPKPYDRNFAHAYNSDIDFVKYREFYPPGMVSPAIALDRSRTLFRPGDTVHVKVTLENPDAVAWRNITLRAEFDDASGKAVQSATLASGLTLDPGAARAVEADAWPIPAAVAPGTYRLKLVLVTSEGRPLARTTSDIAINNVPASLMIFNAHEDDEVAYGGLVRAAVEAGIPVRVVFFTSGDVGACERYYSKPCGPNEAREFGMVRMEESAEALEHLGLPRENLVFLGLPDGGSEEIWSQHINVSNPFLSTSLAADHAPFENVLRPNLPYARESVVEVVKQLIADFRPTMIALTHPDERDVDHRVAAWFALKACDALLRENRLDPATVVLANASYGAGGFKPAPYKYDKATIYLSGEAAALKQEMTWIYQSQDGNRSEGMRRTWAELRREEHHLRILDWQQHEGWNE
ncbi:MAG: PIG-L family deacetylase [Acidobacteriia bacterium]|nr:PIG-L family deacetylase [Terriglobia bacterium]